MPETFGAPIGQSLGATEGENNGLLDFPVRN
jgi:hypothetical protein